MSADPKAYEHEPPLEGSAARGREIVYWIAKAAQEMRERAGAEEGEIANLIGKHERTVKRFESVESFPEDLDEMASAYAIVCGLDDERGIYGRAVQMWIEKGDSALEFSRAAQRATSYAERLAGHLAKGAQRAKQQPHDGNAQASTSAQKRREAR